MDIALGKSKDEPACPSTSTQPTQKKYPKKQHNEKKLSSQSQHDT
jgi:hypothetical protein